MDYPQWQWHPCRVVGELPSGTVTSLFTDVEGSTALLSRIGRTLMGSCWPSSAASFAAQVAGSISRVGRQTGVSGIDGPLILFPLLARMVAG